ncbi:hypothetical protein E4L96_10945 [Massilia arenosa]|uniref:Uncharacterized protein n=1 Tax=Zemynaea arenosa TaxID=2561931 RepID=A0A4Y9SC20_9BURK|nr:hypothetical protein [Massilia arenosa]TFW19979.1 hypothetical protein E4L96_10945 [Massilia arenosa]
MTTTTSVIINEIPVDPIDPTKTAWGPSLSAQYYFVIASGTVAAESFDAADLSGAIRTLMATYGRGASIYMGDGDDTVIGSAYGDTITGGSGINHIDGGANTGTTPDGFAARDVLNVFAASQAAADAVGVTEIQAGAGGADGAAYAAGYRIKVTSGSETDYLKGIEQINIFLESDKSYVKSVFTSVNVTEIGGAQDPATSFHLAWVQGTSFSDSFNAASDISSATRALMDQHGRGVWVDLGAGNDTVVGSAYGDDISVGGGTNYVDGGANGGTTPWGGKAQDVLRVTAASQAAADALQVVQLTTGMTGADAQAFAEGYTHKLVNGGEVDYLKGVERVTVQVPNGTGYSFARDIPLAVVVDEANLADPATANYYHLAWVTGTAAADTIDLSANTPLLSTAIKAALAAQGRGVWVDGGAGNDVITGTAYADNFRNGSGNAKIDGGANAGPGGTKGMDVFEITVASTAEMNAVQIAASDDPDYTWMVTYGAGGQKDYLKNIEAITINVAGTLTGKWIPLALSVNEIAADGDLANNMHYAWVQGTGQADTFNAATDVSSATRTLMQSHGRGVYVDTGAGDDTITGSAYGDDFNAGAGVNRIDGGANGGSTPWGGQPLDTLHVNVASQAAAQAVQVTLLDSSATGTDGQAFAAGYTHKVSAGAETDYVKGIERVTVQLNGTWVRDIPLAVVVNEANLSDPNLSTYYHLAWVNGTGNADTINLSGASPLLSSGVRDAMAAQGRGVWVDGGAGNDVITGTAYADNFRNGSGNSKIDGGANAGPNGAKGQDVFEISVATTAEMNAVTVAASDDPDYTWMVTYGAGGQKDYLKNIEAIVVNVNGTSTGKWIPLAMSVNEIAADGDLANSMHYAWAQGTGQADTFNAGTDVSSATRALMQSHGRGVFVDTGAGDDTITGSAYGDDITAGAGVNRVDGGANGGTTPWGGQPQDVLHVVVASQADANAVAVTVLASGGSGADADAFTAGYTHKVTANGETDYVKGIERIAVQVGTSVVREIALAITVNEANLADPNIANYGQLAWVTGTGGADNVDLSGATPLLSAPLRAALAQYQRGVWVDGGAGDDTITGTGYGDVFRNGSGSSKIDGGANAALVGQQARDVFEISVASTADMAAVTVAASDDPAYTWMVTYGAGTQKDYLKNIEAIAINVAGTSTGKWIPLTLSVTEIGGNTNLGQAMHYAWVQGTELADTIDAAALVSSGTQQLMNQNLRGVYIDAGAGNDTITGSAYGDNIVAGAGTNYIDGGTNLGTQPGGTTKALDQVDLYVRSSAEANAVAVTALTTGMTGADAAAYAAGYTFKVTNGTTEIDYVKNVERVNVLLWNDKDGDGQRDVAGTNDPANEVTLVRTLPLSANTAPTFNGVAPGMTAIDAGTDYTFVGATPTTGGKFLTLANMNAAANGDNYLAVLGRINADGTQDTSFGGGTGKVQLPITYGYLNAAPASQPDGKVLLAFGTPGGSPTDMKIVRLLADGSVDTSFGTNGTATVSIGSGNDEPRKILVLGDGKIAVAGTAYNGTDRDFGITRLNADGTLDTSFNGSGTLRVPFGAATSDLATTLSIGSDGKLVLVGSSRSTTAASSGDIGVIRVNVDGTLDTSFGAGGKVLIPVGVGEDVAGASAVLANGKILIAGSSRSGTSDTSDWDTSLIRLNADGTLDTSFGSGGMVKTHVTDGLDRLFALAVQADGKVVVAGSTGATSNATGGMGGIFAVFRYNADGTPDTSFGTNGLARLPGHGLGDQVASIAIVDGKVVLFGSTFNDTGFHTTSIVARLNVDGTLDTSFGNPAGSSLEGTVQADGLHPVVLDANAAIYDAELAARGNYGGATLTLARQGGAVAADQFSATGEVSIVNGVLSVAGTAIGTAQQAGGILTLGFNTGATQGLVNRALHGLAYANPQAADGNVVLEWQFKDGNQDGSQGGGGLLGTTGTTTVYIGTTVTETVRSFVDATQSTTGTKLALLESMARVNGTAGANTFDSASFSGAAKGLMSEFQKGAVFDMGAGDDTVIGTGYGDEFTMGSGTNRVDGGANAGVRPGGAGRDVLNVFVANDAQAGAVAATAMDGTGSADDIAAYAAGYRVKIVNGTEVDYLRNVESVAVLKWNDANGNGIVDQSEATLVRRIALGLQVEEVRVSATDPSKDVSGAALSARATMATATGWVGNDTFDAQTDVSAATRGVMAAQGRGVEVDLGAGDDTITGSAYGDVLVGGAGVNRIDGGGHAGFTPQGSPAVDTLQVYTASSAEANAVALTELTAASTGADLAAYNAGYRFKVTNGSTETDYVKDVQAVDIKTWTDSNGNGVRDAAEVTQVRHIAIEQNAAPVFAGGPAGVAFDFSARDFGTTGAVLGADGKLLNVSYSDSAPSGLYDPYVVLTRANADGSPDTSFGGGTGKVVLPGAYGAATPPVLLAGGNIVLALGSEAQGNVRVVGLLGNGELNPAFGTAGVSVIDFTGGIDRISRVVASGDKVYVIATAGEGAAADFGIARLNANGTLDATFNGTGKAIIPVGTGGEAPRAALLQSDGKLVVAGVSNGDFSALRLNADGSLDTSFGTGGKAIFAVGAGNDAPNDVIQLADGKLLLAGGYRTSAVAGADNGIALMRLNANGTLDATFGTGGIVKSDLTAGNDTIFSVTVQGDGKVLALANVGGVDGLGGRTTVLRFNANGTLDTAFGNNGSARVPGLGIGDQVNNIFVVDGKIVVTGNSFKNLDFDVANVVARLNADGTLDTSFHPNTTSTIGGTVRADGIHAVAMDPNAAVYDANLAARGNYGGASLALVRHGGASAEDVFRGVGDVSFANGKLTVGGIEIGTAVQDAGTLTLTFNTAATQGLVNRALSGIGYTKVSPTPSTTLTFDWTFSDNNTDASQGFGGAASTTGSSQVQLGVVVEEITAKHDNPAESTDGNTPMNKVDYFGTVNGTKLGDTFDAATGFSAAARAAMDQYQKGAAFNMGAGDNTVTGTGYGDEFIMGAGTSRINGGANAGTGFGGRPSRDVLNVLVSSAAAADDVKVIKLDASATSDADIAARDAGYELKVVNGTETDYARNIETVRIWLWTDANGDGLPAQNEQTYVREISIELRVDEIQVSATDPTRDTGGHLLSTDMHFAWAWGWGRADTVDAATLSAATTALMAQYQRGMFIDTGAGDDTITGTAYGDNITAGSGTNRVDGGADLGTTPDGRAAQDYLDVYAADAAAAAAVEVTLLSDSGSDSDKAAFADNYVAKVKSGSETTYVKNIEAINVSVWNDANHNGVRDTNETSFHHQVALVPQINESANPAPGDWHAAFVNGGLANDSFNAATDLSAAALATMARVGRGVWGTMGAGDDTVTGSAYGDTFTLGAGVNRFDGGANMGETPQGHAANDILEVHAASAAAAAAVTVDALSGAADSPDKAFYDAGYRFKVTNGGNETDYLKNVEQVNIFDGDQYVRTVNLTSNAAPDFGGQPGESITAAGSDLTPVGMAVLPGGGTVSLTVMNEVDAGSNYSLYLVRHLADGTLDASFSGGRSLAVVPRFFWSAAAPAATADGKILVALGTAVAAGSDWNVVRMNADGTLDTSFATNGVAAFQQMTGRPSSVVVQQDGKIILTGNAPGAGNALDAVAIRLNANGTLDTTFNGSGKTSFAWAAGTNRVGSTIVDSDGKIIITGTAPDAEGGALAITRLNADGSSDTSFNGTGRVTLSTAAGKEDGGAVAVMSDHRIVLLDVTRTTDSNNVEHRETTIVRLKADGSLDTTWAGDGTLALHSDTGDGRATQLLVQPDGKVVIAGFVNGPNNNGGTLTVARFNIDGTADQSFGIGGAVEIPGHGLQDVATAIALVNGKILVQANSPFNTNFDTTVLLARLNADGTLDATFNQGGQSTIGGSVKADGIHAVVLDRDGTVFDADLSARGNYGGSHLKIERHGGASADDVFNAVGEVSFVDGHVKVDGLDIGWVENANGTLQLHFNNAATQGLVARAIHGIGYVNQAATAPASVSLDWTFNDGNEGSQGLGGVKAATATTTVDIGVTVQEVVKAYLDPAKSATGVPLAQVAYFATVTGSTHAEASPAFSPAVSALMAQFQKGARFETGGGNDTVAGTAYSDVFITGSGTNQIDGRGQAGQTIDNHPGEDVLEVYATTAGGAAAVRVIQLDAASTGFDKGMFDAGYTVKVVNGGETDYLKDIERVVIFGWNDTNNNRIRDNGETHYAREVALALRVNEILVNPNNPEQDVDGHPLEDNFHFAWANGWTADDTFSALSNVSAATRALMDQWQRGVYVDTGAGNDTITGSAYGDSITAGSGTNRVDGGANTGTAPDGHPATDSLEVFTASATDAAAVTVTALGVGDTGADHDAFAAGYAYKVSAGAETDYIKNIENIRVSVWNDANGNGVREGSEIAYHHDVQLVPFYGGVEMSATSASTDAHGNALEFFDTFGYIGGTLGSDTVSAANLSSLTLQRMEQFQHGAYFELGAGDDTATGSAYEDGFVLGAGTNYADGGDNLGQRPWGQAADNLDIFVGSTADAAAVTVAALTGTLSGADAAAQAQGYQYKVVAGAEIDYIKNIERVNVRVWNDANHDGQRDWNTEVTDHHFVNFAPQMVSTNEGDVDLQVAEGALNPAGLTVAQLMAHDTLTGDFGNLPKAMIVNDIDTNVGTWQYSLDGGASWLTMRADLIDGAANIGLVLDAAARIRLLPFGDASGDTSLQYHGWRTAGAAASGTYTNFNQDDVSASAHQSVVRANVSRADDAPVLGAGGGYVTHQIGAPTPFTNGGNGAVVPDGVLLADGSMISITAIRPEANGDVYKWALVHTLADGSLDLSYGTGGRLMLGVTPNADVTPDLTLLPDGSVLATIVVQSVDAPWKTLLVKAKANGTLDSAFGNGGGVTLVGTDDFEASGVAVQADGKIVVAGRNFVGGTNTYEVVRLAADGTLDPTFGDGGKTIVNLGAGNHQLNALALHADGSIVVAGVTNTGGNNDFELVRLSAGGNLQDWFGTHGRVVTPVGVATDDARAVTALSDGGFIVAGSAMDGSRKAALVKYHGDGTLDTSFGTGGKLMLDFLPGDDSVQRVVEAPDGRLLLSLAVGGTAVVNKTLLGVARLNHDGSLDGSFGHNGLATLAVGTVADQGRGIIVQPDGKIAVVGYSVTDAAFNSDLLIARFNSDGSLDTSFGMDDGIDLTVAHATASTPVLLNPILSVFDAELAATSYDGAHLTIARLGGANAGDVFSTAGSVHVAGTDLLVGTALVGTLEQNGGTLSVSFDHGATQAQVIQVMRGIAYANAGAADGTVAMQWTFSEGGHEVGGVTHVHTGAGTAADEDYLLSTGGGVDGADGWDTAGALWSADPALGLARLTTSKTTADGHAVITVSQVQGTVTTGLLTLTRAAEGDWTMDVLAGQDARVHGADGAALGSQHLQNVEEFILFQDGADPFQVILVGVAP